MDSIEYLMIKSFIHDNEDGEDLFNEFLLTFRWKSYSVRQKRNSNLWLFSRFHHVVNKHQCLSNLPEILSCQMLFAWNWFYSSSNSRYSHLLSLASPSETFGKSGTSEIRVESSVSNWQLLSLDSSQILPFIEKKKTWKK